MVLSTVTPWGGFLRCNSTEECFASVSASDQIARGECMPLRIDGETVNVCKCNLYHGRSGVDCAELDDLSLFHITTLAIGALACLWYIIVSILCVKRGYYKVKRVLSNRSDRTASNFMRRILWNDAGISLLLSLTTHTLLFVDVVFRIDEFFVMERDEFVKRKDNKFLFRVAIMFCMAAVIQVSLTWLSSITPPRVLRNRGMVNLRKVVFGVLVVCNGVMLVTAFNPNAALAYNIAAGFAALFPGSLYLYAGMRLTSVMKKVLKLSGGDDGVSQEALASMQVLLWRVRNACWRLSSLVLLLVTQATANIVVNLLPRHSDVPESVDYLGPFVRGASTLVIALTVGTVTDFVYSSASLGKTYKQHNASDAGTGNFSREFTSNEDAHERLLHTIMSDRKFDNTSTVVLS